MVRNGARHCDLCAAEILGHGGTDVCVICRIVMEDNAGLGNQDRTVDALAEAEGFALTAVVGRSYFGLDEARAANDEQPTRHTPHRVRRHGQVRRFSVPRGMVRIAEGLRSISKRCLD